MTAPGQTPDIAGYRDLTPISRGETALVFEAVQDRGARRVAVKVLRVDHEAAEQARVRRELATTVLLSGHPYIVDILDTGVTAQGAARHRHRAAHAQGCTDRRQAGRRLGGPRGTPLNFQKLLDPGSTTLTLQGLSATQEYCYQVLAILGVDEYARSETVCTNRSW